VRLFPCRIKTLKDELSLQDATILEDAVMNPEWPCRTLETELFRKGLLLSEKLIRKHREKRCSCWKT
jgi:hypothetical protein